MKRRFYVDMREQSAASGRLNMGSRIDWAIRGWEGVAREEERRGDQEK